jgi:hypothetical protein
MGDKLELASWVPDSLKQEIRNNDTFPGSLNPLKLGERQKYARRLLHDPRMEKAWGRLTGKGVDPVAFYFFVAKIAEDISQNFSVKKKTPTELEGWELEIKRTARLLTKLVHLTPYDRILENMGLEITKIGSFGNIAADIHSLSDVLRAVSYNGIRDLDSKEQFTRLGERQIKDSWIPREFIVPIDVYLREETTRPMADVTAAVVNSLMNRIPEKEFISRTVSQLVADYKKTKNQQ